ncbi:MAG: hypothetical protein MH252_09645 [Thermosynechococcaceae cyanobacterium MS004]|nr:hypothetical protein [Thermosynechococcaceae cyanobacterium MS004]
MGAETLKNALAGMLQSWLVDHPVLGWCLSHPLWAIASSLLTLFLGWGFLRAIARLVETLWIRLLQIPLQLSRWLVIGLLWLFRLVFQSTKAAALETSPSAIDSVRDSDPQVISASTDISASLNGRSPLISASLILKPEHQSSGLAADLPLENQRQLRKIMMRLEQLQREQAQLLQEARSLLSQSKPAVQPHVVALKTPPENLLGKAKFGTEFDAELDAEFNAELGTEFGAEG